MNERIRQLAEQANLTEVIDSAYLERNDWQPFVGKFAESLIEECIQVLKDTGYPNAHGNCVGVEELKQHFGIK